MLKYNSILIVLIIMFTCSCKKTTSDDNCASTSISGILSATSTTLTGNINQEINFELLYGIANGCSISSEVETLKEGNIVSIKVMTKSVGCVCTAIYFEGKKTYIFKSPTAGNFKLKFNTGNNNFIEKDVVIQ
jgi:hypothetical protein